MSSSHIRHFSNHNDYNHTRSPSYSTPIADSEQYPHTTQRAYLESAAYTQTLAFLQQHSQLDVEPRTDAFSNSNHITSTNQPRPAAHLLPSIWTNAPDSLPHVDSLYTPSQHSRSMYQGQRGQYRNSPLGTPAPHVNYAAKTTHTHQRTSSASTVASTGPASPFSYNSLFPQVAQSEYTPQSPSADFWDFSASQADQPSFSFSKHPLSQTDSFFLNAPGYMPSQAVQTPPAHLAMKGFAIDHHNLEDLPTEVTHSSRQSMSSVGQNSPATPRSTADDNDNKPVKTNSNGEIAMRDSDSWDDYLLFGNSDYTRSNPNVQLHRTESAAYQDELYNPANFAAPAPSASKPSNNFLTPHRNLVNERLQTANIARSVSPSSVSRERSPFRHGSPLAPAQDAWNSPRMGTQAGLRQQQKEETAQAEIAQHRPALKREATKTISPKDALLDYTETDQQPLFQDTIPTGYKQHFGGTEQFPQNFFSQGNAAFATGLPTSQPNMTSFRATNSADGLSGGNFSVSPSMQGQVQPSLQAGQYQQASSNMNTSFPTGSLAEPTPDFPAHLTSMESSMSEGNPGPSSQEGPSLPVQRPDDTRANTGTYTCTYHGCTQRFESQPALQRHKRDYHRSQAQNNRDSGPDSGATSVSPSSPGARSTESPAPSDDVDESGMTSAALLARNSQAGPHKCSRINPSTGKPCNTVFSRPYDLTRHEDTIHNNRKMKVRCPHCREEKTFSRNDALTRHMRVVHPEADSYGKRGRHD
jgi:hypothetical protein